MVATLRDSWPAHNVCLSEIRHILRLLRLGLRDVFVNRRPTPGCLTPRSYRSEARGPLPTKMFPLHNPTAFQATTRWATAGTYGMVVVPDCKANHIHA
jgi:hypothetical protein